MNPFILWVISNNITTSEFILNLFLFLLFIMLCVTLWKLHRGNGRYKNFNLVFLLVNKDGYPDGAKVIEIGTWLLLSWGLIVYVTAKALPEWYLITYTGAFIARGGYGAYLRSKGEPAEQVGTTVKTEAVVTTKTTEVSTPTVAPKIIVDEPAK